MGGFTASQGSARVASAIVATILGGCALPATRPSPQPAQAATSVRSDGARTFDKWCGDCHHPATGPGSIALQRRYQGSFSAILEERRDLQPGYVSLVVRRGISFMPSFRKTEISDAELAQLAAYLAHAQ
jgi:mono/diheme cytochrome c family protein